jgi:hypothetical protein
MRRFLIVPISEFIDQNLMLTPSSFDQSPLASAPLSPSTHSSNLSLLLDDPSTPIKDILRDPGILTAFKSKSEKLVSRLSDRNSMWELMMLFQTSGDRVLLTAIAQLFLSQNQILLSQFISDGSILESMSAIMIHRAPERWFTVGLFMQIIVHAASLSPVKLTELLYRSPTFWPGVLMSIDLDVVSSGANQLLQTLSGAQHSFLWGYFLAVLPAHRSDILPPSAWSLASLVIQNCVCVRLTARHRAKLFQLFKSYLLSFPDNQEFPKAIEEELKHIVPVLETSAEKVRMFDLAMCLSRRAAVLRYAGDLICPSPVFTDPAVERAVLYIAQFFDLGQLQVIATFIFKVTTAPLVPVLLYHATRSLIEALLGKLASRRLFVRFVQHCIAYAWNRKGCDCPMSKRAFLLDLADFLGPHPSFEGWSLFLGHVVRHYHRHTVFPVDFQIPEGTMDQTMLQPFLDGTDAPGSAFSESPASPARRSSLGSESTNSARMARRPNRPRRDSLDKLIKTDGLLDRVPLTSDVEPPGSQTQALRRNHRKRDRKKKCTIA